MAIRRWAMFNSMHAMEAAIVTSSCVPGGGCSVEVTSFPSDCCKAPPTPHKHKASHHRLALLASLPNQFLPDPPTIHACYRHSLQCTNRCCPNPLSSPVPFLLQTMTRSGNLSSCLRSFLHWMQLVFVQRGSRTATKPPPKSETIPQTPMLELS